MTKDPKKKESSNILPPGDPATQTVNYHTLSFPEPPGSASDLSPRKPESITMISMQKGICDNHTPSETSQADPQELSDVHASALRSSIGIYLPVYRFGLVPDGLGNNVPDAGTVEETYDIYSRVIVPYLRIHHQRSEDKFSESDLFPLVAQMPDAFVDNYTGVVHITLESYVQMSSEVIAETQRWSKEQKRIYDAEREATRWAQGKLKELERLVGQRDKQIADLVQYKASTLHAEGDAVKQLEQANAQIASLETRLQRKTEAWETTESTIRQQYTDAMDAVHSMEAQLEAAKAGIAENASLHEKVIEFTRLNREIARRLEAAERLQANWPEMISRVRAEYQGRASKDKRLLEERADEITRLQRGNSVYSNFMTALADHPRIMSLIRSDERLSFLRDHIPELNSGNQGDSGRRYLTVFFRFDSQGLGSEDARSIMEYVCSERCLGLFCDNGLEYGFRSAVGAKVMSSNPEEDLIRLMEVYQSISQEMAKRRRRFAVIVGTHDQESELKLTERLQNTGSTFFPYYFGMPVDPVVGYMPMPGVILTNPAKNYVDMLKGTPQMNGSLGLASFPLQSKDPKTGEYVTREVPILQRLDA